MSRLTEPLTVRGAAERCGLSQYTIRCWLRQRRIPHYRLGRRIVLDGADVEAFLAAGRVEARHSERDHG